MNQSRKILKLNNNLRALLNGLEGGQGVICTVVNGVLSAGPSVTPAIEDCELVFSGNRSRGELNEVKQAFNSFKGHSSQNVHKLAQNVFQITGTKVPTRAQTRFGNIFSYVRDEYGYCNCYEMYTKRSYHEGKFVGREKTRQKDIETDRKYNAENSHVAQVKQATYGWSYGEVVNLANGLSMARLFSGPVIAALIISGEYDIAFPALALSSLTDWLDGYVARMQNIRSILGSYLDPLADKVLVGSVVGAMGYTGAIPPVLVGVILGRDVYLVVGAFAARAHALNWKWPGLKQFFSIDSSSSPIASYQDTETSVPAAPKVEPLFISKVNTALQLSLVASCMTHVWLGWPSEFFNLYILGPTTGCTTIWSCVAYTRAYLNGDISLAKTAHPAPGGQPT